MRLKLIISFLVLSTCGGGSQPVGKIGELGEVCGSSAIIGVAERAVTSPNSRQCGISNPVRLHEVAGVRLSQKPLLNCKTARAQRLESLRVVAHYTCRTRNNQSGGKISEHGKGNAIDIAAFRLRDGTEISVLKDWNEGQKGRALKAIHGSACGPFGVVLGPNSDAFHRDHFHLDTSNLGRPFCQ